MSSGATTSFRKKRIKPYAQGDLDYMCAVYSIINASRALCPEIDDTISTRLFRHLITKLDTHSNNVLIPLTLGTDSTLLRKLLEEALSYVQKRLKITLVVEIKKNSIDRRSLSRAWAGLNKLLDDQTIAIAAIDGRCNHWTVFYDVKPRKIRLLDSGYRRKLARKSCTLRPTKKLYRLHLASLVTLRRAT